MSRFGGFRIMGSVEACMRDGRSNFISVYSPCRIRRAFTVRDQLDPVATRYRGKGSLRMAGCTSKPHLQQVFVQPKVLKGLR